MLQMIENDSYRKTIDSIFDMFFSKAGYIYMWNTNSLFYQKLKTSRRKKDQEKFILEEPRVKDPRLFFPIMHFF